MKNPLKTEAVTNLIKKKEIAEAIKERGMRQLKRLETLIDVIFGIMIFRLFLALPRPEVDGFGASDLVRVLKESYLNYMVMGVGLFMILIYWGQSNLIFGNLVRTSGKHAVVSILGVFSLLVYFYFVRLDMEFDGAIIALQMESIFLALAGFLSIWAWHIGIKGNLSTATLSEEDKRKVYIKLMPEPVVSLLTFPFASFGPDIWTLSWLLLIPVSIIANKMGKRMNVDQTKD